MKSRDNIIKPYDQLYIIPNDFIIPIDILVNVKQCKAFSIRTSIEAVQKAKW